MQPIIWTVPQYKTLALWLSKSSLYDLVICMQLIYPISWGPKSDSSLKKKISFRNSWEILNWIHKMTLCVFINTAYRTDAGVPWVLPVVKTVESNMVQDETLNKEYLPVAGSPEYRTAGIKLLLGEDSPAIAQNKVRTECWCSTLKQKYSCRPN